MEQAGKDAVKALGESAVETARGIGRLQGGKVPVLSYQFGKITGDNAHVGDAVAKKYKGARKNESLRNALNTAVEKDESKGAPSAGDHS
jgi:hypothetical protein